tara:strand:- start:4916 stop:5344 length:429 start_codon:yes stop_codon:yes gene_type:complete
VNVNTPPEFDVVVLSRLSVVLFIFTVPEVILSDFKVIVRTVESVTVRVLQVKQVVPPQQFASPTVQVEVLAGDVQLSHTPVDVVAQVPLNPAITSTPVELKVRLEVPVTSVIVISAVAERLPKRRMLKKLRLNFERMFHPMV